MKLKFTAALLIALLSSFSGNAQMTGVTWEVDTAFYEPTTFDVDGNMLFEELEGFVTYKLFAEFANPTDELSAIYSDVEVLGNPPIYVDAPCGCFNPVLGDVLLGGLQNPALVDFFPEVLYDTYWTLGFAQGEQAILSNTAYNSTTMCSEVEEGGLFFTPFLKRLVMTCAFNSLKSPHAVLSS